MTEQKNSLMKPTNPKDLVGQKKVNFSTLSWPVIAEMAVGMHEGARKYGRHNYREKGVCASTYFDACLRHLVDWFEGKDIDSASGLHHITKLMTSAMVLRDAMLNEKLTDDRPIKVLNAEWLEILNDKTALLIEKYPEPKKPHTQKSL